MSIKINSIIKLTISFCMVIYACNLRATNNLNQNILFNDIELLGKNIYQPNVELLGRYTPKRKYVTRIGVLLPLLYNHNNLFYLTTFGMHDIQKILVGNFGLGYRKLFKNTIFGMYGYYDIKSTKLKYKLSELCFGIESTLPNLEFRANVYIPISKPIYINQKRLISPMYGGDIEVKFVTPYFNRLLVSGTYYYFDAKKAQKIHGVRIAGELVITSFLNLFVERSLDNYHNDIKTIGIKLHYQFGNSNKANNILYSKMTQLPARNVDIVTQNIPHEQNVFCKKKEGKLPVYNESNSPEEDSIINNSNGDDIVPINNNQPPPSQESHNTTTAPVVSTPPMMPSPPINVNNPKYIITPRKNRRLE